MELSNILEKYKDLENQSKQILTAAFNVLFSIFIQTALTSERTASSIFSELFKASSEIFRTWWHNLHEPALFGRNFNTSVDALLHKNFSHEAPPRPSIVDKSLSGDIKFCSSKLH